MSSDLIKAFVTALKDHLLNNKVNYTTHEYGAGGCETCGYGAEEYEVLDFPDLEKEIDKFSEQFKLHRN